MHGRKVAGLVVVASLALTARARAYTISSALTDGCHERITTEALRSVRKELPTTASPLPTTSDENALVDDVPFSPDDDMKDLGAITFLLAVRDNDLKGRGANDLSSLAEVHGDPGNQHEHCLRAAGQKEPGGTQAALIACRAFIRQRVSEALDGLDASGRPDPAKRTMLRVHLNMRGTVDAPLPTYYVRLGQAIHTLQDGFTHTYRTADQLKVTAALDWLEQVDGTLDEATDGPPHAMELDRCDDPDTLRTNRRRLALEASTTLLRATLDPTKTRDQKLAAVDALLTTYLDHQPGCTFDNHWCNAPENEYRDPTGCGCGFADTGSGLGGTLAMSTIALLAVRRARKRRQMMRGRTGAFALGAVALLVPATARAAEEKVPPPTVVPVAQPGPDDPSETALGGYLGFSGSLDKPAVAGTAGARLRVSKRWAFGLDAEWNPWIAYTGKPLRSGAFNVYGTAMLRFPLAYEKFNLRTSVSLGTSYLLMDLYGAPRGSYGVYFGFSPLALEWKLSRVFYLVIAPINIALPMPKITGVPLLYPQYRLSIGLEFYAG
jgi:hypothetical protein